MRAGMAHPTVIPARARRDFLGTACACLQEELLAELLDDEVQQQGSKGGSKKSKKKKGKQGKAKSVPGPSEPPAVAAQQAAAAKASAVTDQPLAATKQAEKQEQLHLVDTTDQQHRQEQRQQLQESRPCAEPSCAAPLPIKTPADKSIASDDEQQPGSSEWQVVGRRKREEQLQQQPLLQQHLDASSGAPLRRCPSASSLGSSCRYGWAVLCALIHCHLTRLSACELWSWHSKPCPHPVLLLTNPCVQRREPRYCGQQSTVGAHPSISLQQCSSGTRHCQACSGAPPTVCSCCSGGRPGQAGLGQACSSSGGSRLPSAARQAAAGAAAAAPASSCCE